MPRSDQKLLVLHYSVQNPTPRDLSLYWGDMTFTAVDAKDVNHKFVGNISREGTTDELNLSLKPAQRIDVYTAILVPAGGEVPKLIVEREAGAPVIRYDLRGKVKGIPAPFADPSDSTGATARSEIPAAVGINYPTGEYDIRLDSVGYTKQTISGREPGAGTRFFTAIFTIKNRTTSDKEYYWGYFAPEVIDADGEKVAYNQQLMKATRDEIANGKLKPGEEARVRFFFALPDNVAARTLKQSVFYSLSSQHARTFAFDVSSAK